MRIFLICWTKNVKKSSFFNDFIFFKHFFGEDTQYFCIFAVSKEGFSSRRERIAPTIRNTSVC